MSHPSELRLVVAAILTRLIAWARATDDYPNRCHGALAANPRWRCYRDHGHDGTHLHINDRSYTVEWS